MLKLIKHKNTKITEVPMRLLYSEVQDAFHLEDAKKPFFNSGGYEVLSECIKYEDAKNFIAYMRRIYPVCLPVISEIKEKIKLLEL